MKPIKNTSRLLGAAAILLFLALAPACHVTPKVSVETDVKVTGVNLNIAAINILPNGTFQMHAKVNPTDADNPSCLWTSSNEAAASVDQTGLVHGNSVGSAVITVTTEDGSFTAHCNVYVLDGSVQGISLNTQTEELVIGDSLQLTATITPDIAINKNISWSVAPEGFVTVSTGGTVQAIAKGTAVVTATSADGGHTAQCTVTVDDRAVNSVSLDTAAAEIHPYESMQLTATVLPVYAENKTVIWSSDPAGIVAVTQTGEVSALAAGSCTVTATTEDGGFAASCAITVTPVSVTGITLDGDIKILHPADTLLLAATISPANATISGFAFSSSDTDIVSVDGNGNLAFEGTGRAVITVTSDDGGFTDSCEIIACTESAFISVWNMSDTMQLSMPLRNGGTYNFTADWGDGSVGTFTTNSAVHTYSQTGAYIVVVEGTLSGFGFERYVSGNKNDLIDIMQWGGVLLYEYGNQFNGCGNLAGFSAQDIPDLSSVQSFSGIFRDAVRFNADLSGWDTSSATNMDEAFRGTSVFNGDISGWNTSNVTSMNYMFAFAPSFNQPIGTWIMSNVSDISGMFKYASAFSQDISQWDTGNLTRMNETFSDANSFNSDIGDWDVSDVTSMMNLFYANTSFDQDLSEWNISNVTNMNRAFSGSRFTNGGNPAGLENWQPKTGCTMDSMFSGCPLNPLPSWY